MTIQSLTTRPMDRFLEYDPWQEVNADDDHSNGQDQVDPTSIGGTMMWQLLMAMPSLSLSLRREPSQSNSRLMIICTDAGNTFVRHTST